jgi:hypothetical protein
LKVDDPREKVAPGLMDKPPAATAGTIRKQISPARRMDLNIFMELSSLMWPDCDLA